MDGAIVFTNIIFFICICRNKKTFFLKILCKSWGLFVTYWLPSEYRVVILTNESEKVSFHLWLYRLTKKGKNDHLWKCHVTITKKRKNLLKIKYRVTLASTKAKTFSSQIIVEFSFSKNNPLLSTTSLLSRSPMAYNTTKTLDKLVVPTMRILAKNKTDLDAFLGPKRTPTTWILN